MKDFSMSFGVLGLIAVFAITILAWKIIDSSLEVSSQRLTAPASWQGSSNPPITESEREKPDAVTWSDPG